MTQKSNNLERFWQELKRRRVFKVVAMYAGSAFVIIQVIDILASPLNLPPWIMTLVVVLLSIGFPLAAILAWIFDLTSEGIKKTESIEELAGKELLTAHGRRRLKTSDIVIAVLAIAVIILGWPKIFKPDTLERLRSKGERIAVAVMPFQNMTNDTTWNIWQDGIKDELINYLTNYNEELEVRQTESIDGLLYSKGLTNYASITPSVASTISQKLDAKLTICGSIKQAGDKIRINAQIFDSKTVEALKSFQIEEQYKEGNILNITDSLSVMVKNFLIISQLKQKVDHENLLFITTNSPEAYRYSISGQNAFKKKDYATAIKYFKQAIIIDSNFITAILPITTAYFNQGLNDSAKKWCLKIYRKRDQLPIQQQIMINVEYALLFETPVEVIKYLRQFLEFDDQMPTLYYLVGLSYNNLNQYNKAIPEFEKALELYKKWDSKPWWSYNYTLLGRSYHETGQYKKEKNLYKKAEQDFQDSPDIIYRQAVLSLVEKDTIMANHFIDKYISIQKDNSMSEANIATGLAGIYSQADDLDKAEEYYCKAISLEPDAIFRKNDLAYFLIDKNYNINSGLELVDEALVRNPNNWRSLFIKGIGLNKKGKNREALKFLEKSDSLKPGYDHILFVNLQAVKKAVAELKNN